MTRSTGVLIGDARVVRLGACVFDVVTGEQAVSVRELLDAGGCVMGIWMCQECYGLHVGVRTADDVDVLVSDGGSVGEGEHYMAL